MQAGFESHSCGLRRGLDGAGASSAGVRGGAGEREWAAPGSQVCCALPAEGEADWGAPPGAGPGCAVLSMQVSAEALAAAVLPVYVLIDHTGTGLEVACPSWALAGKCVSGLNENS